MMSLSSFPLAWRFSDPKYAVLPESVLRTIEPIDETQARTLWNEYAFPEFDHLLKVPAGHTDSRVTSERQFRLDWNDVDDGADKLHMAVPFSHATPVIVFWSPSVAVRTPWQTVIEHWTDFFYPDDDNCVVAFPGQGLRLFFINETVTVQTVRK